jgi:Kef-type K+ transport system membrane component KefB
LILTGVVGKLLAGYAPVWFRGNKAMVGVGMVPRGEVGLIFARMGLETGILDRGLFAAVTLMVMTTTLLAPPWLKLLMIPSSDPGRRPVDQDAIEDLVTEA